MGDPRAATGGSTAAQPTGKRVARHSAEQVTDQPYVGRRVAPQPGRRRAEPGTAPPLPPSFFSEAPAVGRRALRVDVVPFALSPTPEAPQVEATAPLEVPVDVPVEVPVEVAVVAVEQAVIAPVVPEPVPTEAVVPVPEPVVPPVTEPVLTAPRPPQRTPAPTLVIEPVLARSTAPARTPAPTLVIEPVVIEASKPARAAATRTSPGRRAARRRSPSPRPSAPLLMGVAILAVSAGGALQAMHSDTAAAADAHHLAPASALSGSSAIGSASLLGDRAASLSRSSDRLQAAADAQAKQRAETLSGYASKAQKQSAKIQLHAWVLPVAAGVYHLTARFGDYSSLWSNFHTGLDFAAPTGTPIMAVAGGTITETSYSGAYGNRTIETLPDGTELWYCHQNEFGTSVGAAVRPGEVIGYVGSTGNVTGPHLHLEVHPGGGDPVDPYTALIVHGLHP